MCYGISDMLKYVIVFSGIDLYFQMFVHTQTYVLNHIFVWFFNDLGSGGGSYGIVPIVPKNWQTGNH